VPLALEDKSKLELEIAHVLFIILSGIQNRASMSSANFDELNRVVRDTAQFRAAEASGRLTRLPTGDGMALVATTSVETPVECAGNRVRAQGASPARQCMKFIVVPQPRWWMSTIRSQCYRRQNVELPG
jgi:hypothetical protein